MGLALIVFPQRSAVDPWWPHPIQVTLWFVAFLAWAMEVLALRAIVYATRFRGAPAGPRFLFTRTLAALALGIGNGEVNWGWWCTDERDARTASGQYPRAVQRDPSPGLP